MSLIDNITRIGRAKGLSFQEVLTRAKVGRTSVEEDEPTQATLTAIARELAVSEFDLFMKNPRISPVIADFRNTDPCATRGSFNRDTLQTISQVMRIKAAADAIPFKISFEEIKPIKNFRPIDVASHYRDLVINSEDFQINSKDTEFYKSIRDNIENFKIMVMHASFSDGSGFTIAQDEGYDVIVINTLNQNTRRRIFTLIHELGHVLMNNSGLSDVSIEKNSIEQNCNKFAVELLAPIEFAKDQATKWIRSSFSIPEIRSFSNAVKLSLEASVLRLIEIGVYAASAYQAYLDYARYAKEKIQSGGVAREEWKNKLAKYGRTFGRVFGEAKRRQFYDELDIFRISRLKPKYQEDYFSNSVSSPGFVVLG